MTPGFEPFELERLSRTPTPTDGSVSPCQLRRVLYGFRPTHTALKATSPKLLETPASTAPSSTIPQPPPVSQHSLRRDKSQFLACVGDALCCPQLALPGGPQGSWGVAEAQGWLGAMGGRAQERGSLWAASAPCPRPSPAANLGPVS